MLATNSAKRGAMVLGNSLKRANELGADILVRPASETRSMKPILRDLIS